MCNPVALAWVGTAIAAGGQIQQAQTQNAIAQVQAKQLIYAAQSAAEAGAVAEQQHRDKVKQLLATQTAAAGASGADVQSQSFGKVMEQTATMGELDAQTIRTNALREVYGLKTQATNVAWQGEAMKLAGYGRAVGTALTGFAQGSQYSDWTKKKSPSDTSPPVVDGSPDGGK